MAVSLNLSEYRNRHSLGDKIERALWNIMWLLLFRPSPNHSRIFNMWRIFILRCFGANIGRSCVIKNSCEIWLPKNLELGDWVALDEKVVCYNVDRISIGSQSTVSREAFICCAGHDIHSRTMELTFAPVSIGENCWIASRSAILPGVTIGDGVVVGACSVVTKNIAPWTVVGWNPAKFLKKREIGKEGNHV